MIVTNTQSFQAAAFEQIVRASSQLNREYLVGVIEALIFAAPAPLTLRELTRTTKANREQVRDVLGALAEHYASRGVQLVETHRGYCFLTNPAFSMAVRGVTGRRPVRLSRAQLETLAIIAYRQPVTRPEIDEIRGVDAGPVLRLLLERDLIRVLGKKEEPGRPLLYGTSEGFLSLFNLKSLADLPTLREFTELSDASKDTYERRLGEQAPTGAIVFDDEPDAPINPTVPLDEERFEAHAGMPPAVMPLEGTDDGGDEDEGLDDEIDNLDDDDLDDDEGSDDGGSTREQEDAGEVFDNEIDHDEEDPESDS